MILQSVYQDLQFALRQLRKSPGFTALAVGTLALGIAANTTIFSWINSTLFNPIPGVRSTSNMLTLQRGERSEQEAEATKNFFHFHGTRPSDNCWTRGGNTASCC